jgi:hypothetical protein
MFAYYNVGRPTYPDVKRLASGSDIIDDTKEVEWLRLRKAESRRRSRLV